MALQKSDFDTLKRERLGRDFERSITDERAKFSGFPTNVVSADQLTNYEGVSFEDLVYQGKDLQAEGFSFRAIDKYREALALGRADRAWMNFTYTSIARCYMNEDKYEQALAYFQLNAEYIQEEGGNRLLCEAFGNVGIAHYAMFNFAMALQSHEVSARVAKTIGFKEGEMRAAANLGNTYGAMGKFKQAVVHHEQQLKHAEELQDKAAMARAMYHLKNDHTSLRDYTRAASYERRRMDKSVIPRNLLSKCDGDWSQAVDQKAGWLCWHDGKNRLFPPKLNSTRHWFTLRGGQMVSHRTVKSNAKAELVIRAAEIIDVAEELPPFGSDGAATSQGFLRIQTHERNYHLSAPSARECHAWIDAIQQGRSAQSSSFATGGVLRPRMNLHKAAFESFKPSPKAERKHGDASRANPLYESPEKQMNDGYHEVQMADMQQQLESSSSTGPTAVQIEETNFSANPVDSQGNDLYESAETVLMRKRSSHRDKLSSGETGGNRNSQTQNLLAPTAFNQRHSMPVKSNRSHGLQQAQRHSTSRLEQQGKLVTYTVRCVGWRSVEGLRQGRPEMLEIFNQMEASPRAGAAEKLLLTLTADAIEVSSKGNRRRKELPAVLWQHSNKAIGVVTCIEKVVMLTSLDTKCTPGSEQAFAYICSDSVVASGLGTILEKHLAAMQPAPPPLPVRVEKSSPSHAEVSVDGYDVLPAHLQAVARVKAQHEPDDGIYATANDCIDLDAFAGRRNQSFGFSELQKDSTTESPGRRLSVDGYDVAVRRSDPTYAQPERSERRLSVDGYDVAVVRAAGGYQSVADILANKSGASVMVVHGVETEETWIDGPDMDETADESTWLNAGSHSTQPEETWLEMGYADETLEKSNPSQDAPGAAENLSTAVANSSHVDHDAISIDIEGAESKPGVPGDATHDASVVSYGFDNVQPEPSSTGKDTNAPVVSYGFGDNSQLPAQETSAPAVSYGFGGGGVNYGFSTAPDDDSDGEEDVNALVSALDVNMGQYLEVTDETDDDMSDLLYVLDQDKDQDC